MEIIQRIERPDGEIVIWRGRDAEGRRTYAATWSREGVAVEPEATTYYSRKAALAAATFAVAD